MSRPFAIVDVFTDHRFAGNQLAVLTDARGLGDDEMQAIAREFNFAESSFLFPPRDPAHSAEVRIFTPTEEMPFAGHPNVGTGYVLGRMGSLFGRPLGDRLLFEEKAGLVVVDLIREGGEVTGSRVTAPRPLVTGPDVAPAIVADLAGLDEADIVTARFRPCFASVGAEFLLAEVTPQALDRAACHIPAFERQEGRVGQSGGFLGLHLHSRDPADPSALDARMFAPLGGVLEDAATGSAAAALGAFLARLDPAVLLYRLRQGRHIGRPSLIEVDVAGDTVRIGGACAPFASGMLAA
jgi:trans-2,3-dihydro-3-hydroxyanthranilate isomerase